MMWRIVSAIRGVRRKFCENYRTCQSGSYNEDEKTTCKKKDCLLNITKEFHNERFHDQKQNPRKRNCHTHHYRNPFDINFNCFLEGVRTGTAILLGLQLIYNRLKYHYGDNKRPLPKEDVSTILQNILFSLSLPRSGHLAILPEKSTEFDNIPPDPHETTSEPSKKSAFTTLSCEATEEITEGIDSLEDWFRNSSFESVTSEPVAEPCSDQKENNEELFAAACREVENAAHMFAADFQNQFGIQHTKNKRYEEAVKHFETSCQLGDPKACFNLGICHEVGLGTKQDFIKAHDYYEKAAQKGHGAALYNLGVYYMEGREPIQKEESKALSLFKLAAQKGVIEAQRFLGAYFIQKGDMQKAVVYLMSAVKAKDIQSQYYLGVCYENGWGVEENQAKAAEMYSHAATGNQVDALYNLATFHELGLGGLPSNKATAIELLRKAADLGHEISSARLKHLKETQVQDAAKMNTLRSSSSSPDLQPHHKSSPLSRKVQSESLLGQLTNFISNTFVTDTNSQSNKCGIGEPCGYSYSMGSSSSEIAIFT